MWGTALGNYTYKMENCHGNICFPDGYDKYHKPVTNNFSVYINIVVRKVSRVDQGLKNIDVHRGMLSYSPRILMAWHDPRLHWNDKKMSIKLNDHMTQKIWTPRITVRTRTQGTRDSRYMDYGRTGNVFIRNR